MRTWEALRAALAAGMNAHLVYLGQAALAESAFAPLTPGDVFQDTVSVAWSRNDRTLVTPATRDNELQFIVLLWAFGPTDYDAQVRAMAMDYAVTQVLDDPDYSQLGNTLDRPVAVGETRCLTAGDKETPNLVWHLAIPITCRIRTSRPEQAIS
jgi:hypothetical protein